MALESVKGGLSFKVLPTEMRKRFNGEMSYAGVDVNDKWVYSKFQVLYNGSDILGTDNDYLMVPDTAVTTADKFKFLMIKHTGYTDKNETTNSSYGVMFAIDAGTPAYGDTDLIVLAPGDTMALKLPNLTVADLHARTCRLTAGVPSAAAVSGETALIEIAAILDDVAYEII